MKRVRKLEIYHCVVCVVSKKNSQVVSWIEQSEIRDQRVLAPTGETRVEFVFNALSRSPLEVLLGE